MYTKEKEQFKRYKTMNILTTSQREIWIFVLNKAPNGIYKFMYMSY